MNTYTTLSYLNSICMWNNFIPYYTFIANLQLTLFQYYYDFFLCVADQTTEPLWLAAKNERYLSNLTNATTNASEHIRQFFFFFVMLSLVTNLMNLVVFWCSNGWCSHTQWYWPLFVSNNFVAIKTHQFKLVAREN